MAALRQYMVPEANVPDLLAQAELLDLADAVIFVGTSTGKGKTFHHYEFLFRLEDVVPVNASADRFIAKPDEIIPHSFIGYQTLTEYELTQIPV